MSDTIQIQRLTPRAVRERIDAALCEGSVDVTALADFVALVDWSGSDARTSPAADIVGRLQALVSEFADGLIDLPTYMSGLVALAYEDIVIVAQKPASVATSTNTGYSSSPRITPIPAIGALSFTS